MRIVMGIALCWAMLVAASCDGRAVIPERELPAGWQMLPSSQMPPICKTPWWRKNPELLRGKRAREATEYLPVGGSPTRATMIGAVIYGKGDEHRVLVFTFGYASSQDARAEHDAIRADAQAGSLTGYSRRDTNTVIHMSFSPDCPDRDFFRKHFHAMAAPELNE